MPKADEKKDLPNVRALKAFRLKGIPVPKGTVISKREFARREDWLNLANMTPPKVEQTGDQTGMPEDEVDDDPPAPAPAPAPKPGK